ncbi:MAG: hypothetical protein LBV16_07970 [Elusimicrobiota bacterium]|jgi:hypothetical protein|nr:hypothetical protein [Elusimicrobiota bacterium]
MKSDVIIKQGGLEILEKHLGLVDMERFVALMSRKPFDYTAWRETQIDTMTAREYSKKAMEYQKQQESTIG